MTTAGAGSQPPLPLKGVQLPARAPASPSPFSLRPQPGRSWEGVHTKRGTGERRSGRSRLPRPCVPSPRRRPVTTPPIVAPVPHAPCAQGPRTRRAAGKRGPPGSSAEARAPGKPWPRREDSNSRRLGPGGRASAMLPGKVGPPGRGGARRPRARGRGGESESGSYRAPHSRPLPRAAGAGRRGRGAVPRWRRWRRLRARLGGAAARLGAGRRRKRGEAGFLAAGCEKCSCPCAAAGEATSGAARGGAGLRAPGTQAAAPPDPLPRSRSRSRDQEANAVTGGMGKRHLGNIRTSSCVYSRAICSDRSTRGPRRLNGESRVFPLWPGAAMPTWGAP